MESKVNETRIISLLGLPRSGTTIAADFLASQRGYFNIGEMQSFTTRSLGKGGKCQCGETVFDCNFWSKILNDLSESDLKNLTWIRKNLLSCVLQLKFGFPSTNTKRALSAITKLYSLILESVGDHAVIDTSKNPLWHAIVRRALFGKTLIVFWYRGGESVINSFESREQSYHGTYLISYLVLRRILFRKRIVAVRQRFEEFVMRPGRFLQLVDASLNYFPDTEEFKRDPNVMSFFRTVAHSIAGNPVRLQSGEVKIELGSVTPRLSRHGGIAAKLINMLG